MIFTCEANVIKDASDIFLYLQCRVVPEATKQMSVLIFDSETLLITNIQTVSV